MPDHTNTLRFTNEGGTNHIVLNSVDIAMKVNVDDFSITLDPITLRPVLTVKYELDDVEVDVEGAAVVEVEL